MKIERMTNMNTKMRFEVMEKALPYAAELMDCAELKDFKEQMKAGEGFTSGEMMKALMHVFLVSKKEAVLGLLGAVSGKTAEEIQKQEWTETRKLFDDPILGDVCDFFIFSVRMVKNV